MTEQELLDNHWRKESCKVGYLYFKDQFFCKLHNDMVSLYDCQFDNTCIGKANTLDDLNTLQKNYLITLINTKYKVLGLYRYLVTSEFGSCEFTFPNEVSAFNKTLESIIESKFDMSIGWKQVFVNNLNNQYGNQ